MQTLTAVIIQDIVIQSHALPFPPFFHHIIPWYKQKAEPKGSAFQRLLI